MLNIVPLTSATPGPACASSTNWTPSHVGGPAIISVREALDRTMHLDDWSSLFSGDDITVALQAAIDHVYDEWGAKGAIYLGRKKESAGFAPYIISGSIDLYAGISLIGHCPAGESDTKSGTYIRYTGTDDEVIRWSGYGGGWSGGVIKNLMLQAIGNTTCRFFVLRSVSRFLIEDVHTFGGGIVVDVPPDWPAGVGLKLDPFNATNGVGRDNIVAGDTQYFTLNRLVGTDYAIAGLAFQSWWNPRRHGTGASQRMTDGLMMAGRFTGLDTLTADGTGTGVTPIAGTRGIWERPKVGAETQSQGRLFGVHWALNCHGEAAVEVDGCYVIGTDWSTENTPGQDLSHIAPNRPVLLKANSPCRFGAVGGGMFDVGAELGAGAEGAEIFLPNITGGATPGHVKLRDLGGVANKVRIGWRDDVEGIVHEGGAWVPPSGTARPGALYLQGGVVRVAGSGVEMSDMLRLRQDRVYGPAWNSRSIVGSLPGGAEIIEIRGTVMTAATATDRQIGLGIGGVGGSNDDAQHFVRKTINPSASPAYDNPVLMQVTLDVATEGATCQWSPPSPYALAQDTDITDIWINQNGTESDFVVRWEIDYTLPPVGVAATPI